MSQGAPGPSTDRQTGHGATRYLCAGAYLDSAFRDSILRGVLDQDHRAVAPSYSIDVVPILRHSLAAARRELTRDLLVSAIILVGLILAFWQVVGLLALVYAGASALRALRYLGQRNYPGFLVQGLLCVVLLLIGITTLSRNADRLGGVGLLGVAAGGGSRLFLAVLVAVVGTVATLSWYRLSIHQIILDELTEQRFDPQRAPEPPVQYRERLAYLSTAQHGNVTIYARSAQHRPFIGCGELVTNLSVAVPLIPIADEDAARRRSEAPLNPAALYRRMRQALVTLDDPQVPPDERLEGLSLQNRIFVHGLLRPGHPLIDEAKQPRSRITADELQALAADERNRATHYLTARISGWQGELDVTVFMYFSIRGRMLYFEFLGASLQPINSVYHAIDTFPQITGAVTLRAVLSALLETPHVLATAPVNLARPLIDSLRRQLDLRTQLQRIATRVAFDFGADGSVRELGAERNTSNLFHELDRNRYIQTVGRRVTDAIAETLTDFGYSPEGFVEQATLSINNMTLLNNSVITNSAVAIGTEARATARNAAAAPTAAGAATAAPQAPNPPRSR